MNVDQFVAKYNGVHIDEDGYYGAQCWDVSARYAREVVGCPSFPTGSGGAEGLFRIFANPIPNYFDRIANNTSDPNQLPAKGDIIVWNSSFSPPWGHTAVVISANSAGVTVLEQNGNNSGGVSYIKTRGWTGVSGWLRPKKGVDDVSKTDLGIARILTFGILGRNGADGTVNALGGGTDGDLNANHINFETNTKVWQLYNSGEGKDWIERRLPNLITKGKQADVIGKQLADANTSIAMLKGQIDDLAKRPTQSQIDELVKTIDEANTKAINAQAELEKYKTEDKSTENAVIAWLKAIFRIGTK